MISILHQIGEPRSEQSQPNGMWPKWFGDVFADDLSASDLDHFEANEATTIINRVGKVRKLLMVP